MSASSRPEESTLSPLQEAAQRGDTRAVAGLLDQGGDVVATDGLNGPPAVWFALMWHREETARLLIERGAIGRPPHSFYVSDPNALDAAASYGHVAGVGLEDAPSPLGGESAVALRALAERDPAAATSRRELVRAVLDVGGAPTGLTVRVAAWAGDVAVLDAVLDAVPPGDASLAEQEAVTAAVIAPGPGGLATVRHMLDTGRVGDISAALSAVCIAARAPKTSTLDTAALLLEHGADPNTQEAHGVGALHAAASRGHWPLLRALLRAGADVNADSLLGTVLHVICANEVPEIVAELVLQHGADPNRMGGINGHTPLGTLGVNRGPAGASGTLYALGGELGDDPDLLLLRNARPSFVTELLRHGAGSDPAVLAYRDKNETVRAWVEGTHPVAAERAALVSAMKDAVDAPRDVAELCGDYCALLRRPRRHG